MSVAVRLAYFGLRDKDNARETAALNGMEKWLKEKGITLNPTPLKNYTTDQLPEVGCYFFDNDANYKYLNIRLPEDVAMLFKLTWGAGVV